MVKTRLIPTLGPGGAASLHKRMTEETIMRASVLAGKRQDLLEVRFDGASLGQMKNWLGDDLSFVSQGGGDLGERMSRAFHENFRGGKKRVVLIGTDLPDLAPIHIKTAFEALRKCDVVIGPTQDGGYGLIGLKKEDPEIFCGIDWGTASVFGETLQRAAGRGLVVKRLPYLRDVDVPKDLSFWEKANMQFLSVIIPTLNEGKDLAGALRSVGCLPHGEVIIADGGSSDETLRAAAEWGARVVCSKPGRGTQMNAGAACAQGDTLLFLHADSRLPENHAGLIREAMSDPGVVGGAFSLKFKPSSPLLRFIEGTTNLRTRLLRLPYGDQSIFVKSSVFRLIGGFKEIPLMEDVEFVRRLNRAGKVALLSAPVVTSSRKYITQGILRTTWRNKAIFLKYILGVSPDRLALIYYRRAKKRDHEIGPGLHQ